MPTSQNNKLANTIRNKDREIAELKEQLAQHQHDTEVKELKQQIKDLRAKNRRQNKYVEELEEENDEVYKQVHRVDKEKDELETEYIKLVNELAWRVAILEIEYGKVSDKEVNIISEFVSDRQVKYLNKLINKMKNKYEPIEMRAFLCCLCGSTEQGFGNNPFPLKDEGKCCDECNRKVMDERFKRFKEGTWCPK